MNYIWYNNCLPWSTSSNICYMLSVCILPICHCVTSKYTFGLNGYARLKSCKTYFLIPTSEHHPFIERYQICLGLNVYCLWRYCEKNGWNSFFARISIPGYDRQPHLTFVWRARTERNTVELSSSWLIVQLQFASDIHNNTV